MMVCLLYNVSYIKFIIYLFIVVNFIKINQNKYKFFRYVIFYTPFDIGYKVAKFLPVKIVCSAMKEIYR